MEYNQDLLTSVIEQWGVEAQENQAIEECSELITAILHHRRNKCSEDDIITEIADVSIMCEQLRIIYGNDRVDNEIQRKLKRLQIRLEKKVTPTQYS